MHRVADQRRAVGNVRSGVTERARDAPEVARELDLLVQRAGHRRDALERAPENLGGLLEETFRAIGGEWHEDNTFVSRPWDEHRHRETVAESLRVDPHARAMRREGAPP